MALINQQWSSLPEVVVVEIFSYLCVEDRFSAALTCFSWSRCLKAPQLWHIFTFFLYMPHQARYIKSVDAHGKYFKHVYIELDQAVAENRQNACNVLTGLAKVTGKRLQKLRINFCGENPYFYAGQEFIDALCVLFRSENCSSWECLTHVDLSGMTITIDDKIVDSLSENHINLHHLDICNKVFVCKVSPACIVNLLQRCRKLRNIFVFSSSVSDDVLMSIIDNGSLQHLSLQCTREEKYKKKLTSDIWKTLTKRSPNMRVTLKFDHTCPLQCVAEVMMPEVPVKELRLETFTYIYDEVRLAGQQYKKTLEKLVLQTPLSRNSPELNAALLELVNQCKSLKELYVNCVLEQSTVTKILELKTEMKQSGTYTLKYD